VRAYDVVLFVHLLGVVTLFAAFGIFQLGGARLRRAATVDHLRLWLGLLRATTATFPIALLVILAAGLYLADDAWSFSTPWVVVAFVAVVVMLAVGGVVIGRGLNRLGAAAAGAGDGPVPATMRRLVSDPATWVSSLALNGMAVGVLWLMATKPGWGGSVGVVAALTVAGALLGTAAARAPRA
jgi:hypothetical protein